jgi:WD40 repeat protein
VDVAFQPVGPYLLSAGHDRRIVLWQPGETTAAIDHHELPEKPSVLAWSPDGRWAAIGTATGVLHVFALQP